MVYLARKTSHKSDWSMKDKALHPIEAMEQYRVQKNRELRQLFLWMLWQTTLVITKSLFAVALLGAITIMVITWLTDVSFASCVADSLQWLIAAWIVLLVINLVRLHFLLFGER